MKKRKEFIGTVISNKMFKTVVVNVVRRTRHPLYRKIIKRTKHFVAHNEKTEISVGDTVRIVETKPMSKTKHFIVVEKI